MSRSIWRLGTARSSDFEQVPCDDASLDALPVPASRSTVQHLNDESGLAETLEEHLQSSPRGSGPWSCACSSLVAADLLARTSLRLCCGVVRRWAWLSIRPPGVATISA